MIKFTLGAVIGFVAGFNVALIGFILREDLKGEGKRVLRRGEKNDKHGA